MVGSGETRGCTVRAVTRGGAASASEGSAAAAAGPETWGMTARTAHEGVGGRAADVEDDDAMGAPRLGEETSRRVGLLVLVLVLRLGVN